jgi:uncharacterized protein (TIGR02271 family)
MSHHQQIIAAFFDSRGDVDKAVRELESAGIPRNDIKIMPETDDDTTSSFGSAETTGYDAKRDEKGFWASLGNLFLPDEDRYTYAEAMNRGSIMVSVTVDAEHAARAEDILEQYGTVDIEERESGWREEGWRGYSGSSDSRGAMADSISHSTTGMPGSDMAGAGTAGVGMAGTEPVSTSGMGLGALTPGAMDRDRDAEMKLSTESSETTAMGRTGMGAASLGSTDRGMGDRGMGDDVIPIVEERLRVGKRQVNAGRVRVRSYVIETPVEEQVSLRQESVHVERRPVDRAVGSISDENLFRERVIEAEERTEEAVASKEARVTEELVIRKEVEDRTETVRDTVRRTEVDVEDERTGSGSTSGIRTDIDRGR